MDGRPNRCLGRTMLDSMQYTSMNPTDRHALKFLSWRPDASGPLDGVRVLDLSRLVAGNIVSHVLADFGADVVKVEAPGRGDDLRNWKVGGIATYWKVYGRNKRSLALDYRSGRGRELLL